MQTVFVFFVRVKNGLIVFLPSGECLFSMSVPLPRSTMFGLWFSSFLLFYFPLVPYIYIYIYIYIGCKMSPIRRKHAFVECDQHVIVMPWAVRLYVEIIHEL